MKESLLLAASLLLLITATGSAFAQSTNRDHPTPLTSNEIRGELSGNDIEYFYSFTAGPGKLTITVGESGRDVKSIKLGKRQTVILHLTPFKYGKGTYRVRFSGAVALAEHGQK